MQNKILFYFAIYSFLGWCVESIYKSLLEKKIINSGFLHGPFCPIYGFGAVIMILLLSNLPSNIFVIFIASMIFMTMWEYIVGVLLEKIFKTKYWDYSNIKFNINGRVCLKNSVYWGILGVIFTFAIHPWIKIQVAQIPEKTLCYINIVIYIILLIDFISTTIKILFIDKKIQQLYEIGDVIKEKIVELKKQDMLGKVQIENVMMTISDLKKKQALLKRKIYRFIIRLKKAFPTMQSETISKFIEQKMEIKTIKNKKRNNKEE